MTAARPRLGRSEGPVIISSYGTDECKPESPIFFCEGSRTRPQLYGSLIIREFRGKGGQVKHTRFRPPSVFVEQHARIYAAAIDVDRVPLTSDLSPLSSNHLEVRAHTTLVTICESEESSWMR